MNVKLLVAVLASLALASVASGQSSYSVSLSASCHVLYTELDALVSDESRAYSLRLPGRSGTYSRLQSEIQNLQLVPVPHANQDLSELPLTEVEGLRQETRRVTRTESAPNYLGALGGITLGGLVIYSAYVSDSEDGDMEMYTLGALLLAGGVLSLTNTKTVSQNVRDEAAISYNRVLRARVASENAEIVKENRERRAKANERAEAMEENARITAERGRLRDELDRYEDQSRDLYHATVDSLSQEGNRRCIDALVADGVLIQLDGVAANVYILARPINRDGDLLPNATALPDLRFAVSNLEVREPLGLLARIEGQLATQLMEVSVAPIPAEGHDAAYVVRVPVALSVEPVEPDKIHVEGELVAEQDGKVLTARFASDAGLID